VHIAQRIWAQQQLLMAVTVGVPSGLGAKTVILASSNVWRDNERMSEGVLECTLPA
jgi:hypothetical protein